MVINERGVVVSPDDFAGHFVDQDFEGTTLGRSSGTGPIVVEYLSVWGINGSDEPYYDSAGAVAGEAAVLRILDDGVALWKLG